MAFGSDKSDFFGQLAGREASVREKTLRYSVQQYVKQPALSLPSELANKMGVHGPLTIPAMEFTFNGQLTVADDGTATSVIGQYPEILPGGKVESHKLEMYFGNDWQGGVYLDTSDKPVMAVFLRTPGPGILSDYVLCPSQVYSPAAMMFLDARSPKDLFGWKAVVQSTASDRTVVSVANNSGPPNFTPLPGAAPLTETWRFAYDVKSNRPIEGSIFISNPIVGADDTIETWKVLSYAHYGNVDYPSKIVSEQFVAHKLARRNTFTLLSVGHTDEIPVLDLSRKTKVSDFRTQVFRGIRGHFPPANLKRVAYYWPGKLPATSELSKYDTLPKKEEETKLPLIISVTIMLAGFAWLLLSRRRGSTDKP